MPDANIILFFFYTPIIMTPPPALLTAHIYRYNNRSEFYFSVKPTRTG